MFKNFTKTLICLLAIFVCLSNSVMAHHSKRPDNAKQLQGDWHRKVGDDRSNAEVSFSFDSNGNVSWELSVKSSKGKRDGSSKQGKYEVDGNTVVLLYDDGEQEQFQFAVNDDVLTLSRDGKVFVEVDRATSGSSTDSARITGKWFATNMRDGKVSIKTELSLEDGEFKLSIYTATADRTDVIEGSYHLEDGQIMLKSDSGIERLPTRLNRKQLEIDFIGARFVLTRNGRNSNVGPLEK